MVRGIRSRRWWQRLLAVIVAWLAIGTFLFWGFGTSDSGEGPIVTDPPVVETGSGSGPAANPTATTTP